MLNLKQLTSTITAGLLFAAPLNAAAAFSPALRGRFAHSHLDIPSDHFEEPIIRFVSTINKVGDSFILTSVKTSQVLVWTPDLSDKYDLKMKRFLDNLPQDKLVGLNQRMIFMPVAPVGPDVAMASVEKLRFVQ